MRHHWVRRRQNLYDGSAAAYFAAAGITNQTERQAANQFIISMKASGLWTKMDRVWLMSPTSLAAAMYCAKSLQQMSAIGSPTHSASGIALDGTTQYLDTNFSPNTGTANSNSSFHLSCYTNLDTGNENPNALISCLTASAYEYVSYYHEASPNYLEMQGAGHVQGTGEATVSLRKDAFWCVSRINTTDFKGFHGSTQTLTEIGDDSLGVRPTIDLFIGASNDTGTPGDFMLNRVAFASTGGGLTVAEHAIFKAHVESYQTSLGRQNA